MSLKQISPSSVVAMNWITPHPSDGCDPLYITTVLSQQDDDWGIVGDPKIHNSIAPGSTARASITRRNLEPEEARRAEAIEGECWIFTITLVCEDETIVGRAVFAGRGDRPLYRTDWTLLQAEGVEAKSIVFS